MTTYGVDKNGFIVTEVSLDKIHAAFQEILSKITAEITKRFGNKLHSLYLYGSVATSKAKQRTSDLDLLIVFKDKPNPETKTDVTEHQNQLTQKHQETFRDVGIAISDVDEVSQDKYGWGCFIKHLCVCLHGEDIGLKLPKFKPSKEVAKGFNGDIESHIETALKKLTEENAIKTSNSTARKILRTGFSLVMEEEESWTTDLTESCEIFCKYYPKQSKNMRAALNYTQNPTGDLAEIKRFLVDFGGWLIDEAKKKLS